MAAALESTMKDKVDSLAEKIISASRIVVFTGAGVSTESGIRDFRGPDGIWNELDPSDFTYSKFVRSPEVRKRHWEFYRAGLFVDETTKPNLAHYAITELLHMGKLQCVITQNVDDLHQRSGLPADMVIELHGNMKWVKCLSCGKRDPMSNVVARIERDKLQEPLCEKCRGILKPEGIFFGESLPEEALHRATLLSSTCDLFIVVGSTLLVTPAAFMPSYAVEHGADLVIINIGDTPMDKAASLLIAAKAGEILPQVISTVRRRISSE